MSGGWGDGTSMSGHPKRIPPSITVYRDCFHLREAIFLSNSLQKQRSAYGASATCMSLQGQLLDDDCDQSACAMGRDAMQLVDHAYC